eukprot:COSAG02_NODE_10613_length_1900_cov_2.996669_1_plen_25_part_10
MNHDKCALTHAHHRFMDLKFTEFNT